MLQIRTELQNKLNILIWQFYKKTQKAPKNILPHIMLYREVKYMSCCKCKCTCLATIIAILAGVALGILFASGFVATGIIYWAFLAIGVGAVLLLPVYALNRGCDDGEKCFCSYRSLITIAAVGTIVLSAIGLIVPIASTTLTAILLGLATFFVVLLVGFIICFAKCLCRC